ncbi:hypothetical protein F8568_001300 [Actinomadura sp. LD22]|uniref:Uncharacterized protein n=1 Tax=Actinomadura physcomitrii TaxID=2650748 RepID=A0A6I4M3Y5_9ACTN|nr:hypothetical protein [Actinomadura physcomitrii]MVZ99043.1 hypothetical protein [Actinomadura physcomitrii]
MRALSTVELLCAAGNVCLVEISRGHSRPRQLPCFAAVRQAPEWDASLVPHLFHLWLAALDETVPAAETRTYWNGKGDPTPVLDAALLRADYLYVGAWTEEHEPDEPQSGRCPARRIFDWLFWRGTIDRYCVPVLDDHLAEDLLRCFEARPDDLPAPPTAAMDQLRAFLDGHREWGLLPEERPPEHPDKTPAQEGTQ